MGYGCLRNQIIIVCYTSKLKWTTRESWVKAKVKHSPLGTCRVSPKLYKSTKNKLIFRVFLISTGTSTKTKTTLILTSKSEVNRMTILKSAISQNQFRIRFFKQIFVLKLKTFIQLMTDNIRIWTSHS